MIAQTLRTLALLALTTFIAQAQAPAPARPDSLPHPTQDLGDLVRHVLPHRRSHLAARDSARAARPPKAHSLVVLPAVAYTLEARLLATLTASYTFQRPEANLSALSTTLTYTQNQQIILAMNGPLWTSHNHSLWLADYRLLHYPQQTYGLGSNASIYDAIGMDYNLLRVHQSYYHRIGPAGNLYVGGGYFLDTRWNIESVNGEGQQIYTISGYRPGVAGRSTSSGLVVSVLRDTRDNQLRPAAGESYLFLALRANMQALGSDGTYRFFQFDTRRYFHAGPRGNVLAFWLYGDFALGQAVPYLDLPATGWDTYSVTGRGYIQGRFRGTSLVYGEAEYRFNLTRSRVLGGVVFANSQSARNPDTGYGRLAPAGGAGIRLCLSKKSSSYLAVDYAFGVQGSQGVFFNLGDVF
jgi:outer membrane protein assembly factor BamA